MQAKPTLFSMASTPNSPPKYLEEDEITQESKDLLSSLPKERGWVATHLYQYQGFWHTARQLQGVLSCQRNFVAENTDILLATIPKSGTTWLKAIIFSLVNRTRYDPNVKDHPLLSNSPHILVPFLEFELYIDNQFPDLTRFKSPRLFATHVPFDLLPNTVKTSACKLVYLCRNPKDTFVSMWHFRNKLRPQDITRNSLEEVFDKFCNAVSLGGPFWEHVLCYYKESLRQPYKVFFLKFEEMKEEPRHCLRRLAEFLGCSFSQEEEIEGVMEDILGLCSFSKLSNLEVNKDGKLPTGEENKTFFRRGEVGDWKNHLSAEMSDQLDKITEEKLSGSGLKL